MLEQIKFMKQIAERLDQAGIPYMVTGSMAMMLYSVPRMTRDIDLVVEYGPEDAERIAGLFAEDCYVDARSIRQAATGKGMFNIIHTEWAVKADFIVRKAGAYRELEFARRQSVEVEGTQVSVVTPEDLILSKLWWAKDSGSEQQQQDVRNLVNAITGLDWPYLEKWARTLGVDDLLERTRGS